MVQSTVLTFSSGIVLDISAARNMSGIPPSSVAASYNTRKFSRSFASSSSNTSGRLLLLPVHIKYTFKSRDSNHDSMQLTHIIMHQQYYRKSSKFYVVQTCDSFPPSSCSIRFKSNLGPLTSYATSFLFHGLGCLLMRKTVGNCSVSTNKQNGY